MINIEKNLINSITETLYGILRGENPRQIDIPQELPENEIKQLIVYVNALIAEHTEATWEAEATDRLTEAVYRILRGESPPQIELPDDYPENEVKQLTGYMNTFISEYNDFAEFMYSMARGDLNYTPPKGKMKVVQSFKSLQAHLRHLTWKTQKIAAGDFNQKVDFMGDFSSAFNSMTQQLKEAFEKIELQNKQLNEANTIIALEKEKSDGLLRNILPDEIVNELKTTGKAEPRRFHETTILFADIVGFTTMAENIDPSLLVEWLDMIFGKFDDISERYHLEKLKTIGDCYMTVCGVPQPVEDHALRSVRAAFDMIEVIRKYNPFDKEETGKPFFKIRIGIHSGPVVAGIIGHKKFAYDIWGDNVNIAARIEGAGAAGRINVSKNTADLIKDHFICSPRGLIEVRNRGSIDMFWVDGPV